MPLLRNIFSTAKNFAANNIQSTAGSGAPTNGTSGTGAGVSGPGSEYIDIATGIKYTNQGTRSSPLWVSNVQRVSGSITSANITGTSAGQLGHANGVVLLAAPGANLALQLIAFGMYYTYSTAAYTGGGDDTSVRWGAGGAAVSGITTKANMLGASANKESLFLPLAATAMILVSNASLNLVAGTAFTQPGTAAGTVAWELWYRISNVGF